MNKLSAVTANEYFGQGAIGYAFEQQALTLESRDFAVPFRKKHSDRFLHGEVIHPGTVTPGAKVVGVLWVEVQVGLGVFLGEKCDSLLGDGAGVGSFSDALASQLVGGGVGVVGARLVASAQCRKTARGPGFGHPAQRWHIGSQAQEK